jgi:hypothetical protein
MTNVTEKLWASDLPNCDKKFIMNMCLGWSDKKYSKKTRCEFFDDEKEAWRHRIGKPDASVIPFKTMEDEHLYLVVNKKQVLMKEGFLPISFFKYDLQRLSMWRMFGDIEQGGLRIVGMNTDCFHVEGNVVKFVKDNQSRFVTSSKFHNIGKWRVEWDQLCPEKQIEVAQNDMVCEMIESSLPTTVSFPEEQYWDQPKNDFLKKCCQFMKNGNTFVKSAYPGSGKTFVTKQFIKRKKFVFVLPFNLQCESLVKEGLTAITASCLFGLGADEESKGNGFDVTKVKVVIIDEVFLYSRFLLRQLFHYMTQHPKIRFLATGDMYQNSAIENTNYVNKGGSMTHEDIVDFLFPQQLELKIIKRVKNQSDKVPYPQIKEDLFSTSMSVRQVAAKHRHFFGSTFSKLQNLKTEFNICYSNNTRDVVNSQIQGPVPIEKGQKLVLKGYVKSMTRNGTYMVVSVKNRKVKSHTGSVYKLTENQWNLLELPYCWTSYAYQGLTHETEMSVFDIDRPRFLKPLDHKKTFWTAITRATSLKNIHIYTGSTNNVSTGVLDSIISRKLQSHQVYDVNRNIYDGNNFVTVEWVNAQLLQCGRRCGVCGSQMRWNGNSQFSVDRIDNKLGHTRMNCRVICCSCNKAKH